MAVCWNSPVPGGDRFIPNRSLMDLDHAKTLFTGKPGKKDPNSRLSEAYRNKIDENLALDSQGKPFRVLVFKGTPSAATKRIDDELEVAKPSISNYVRHIPKSSACQLLYAPELVDDFYANVLEWGKNDIIAAGLNTCLYLWNAKDGKVSKVMETEDERRDCVTSVSWSESWTSKTVAVGLMSSTIQLWDAQSCKLVRELKGHKSQVSCLAWKGETTLTSGSKDRSIIVHDVRMKESLTCRVRAGAAVCGLKWSSSSSSSSSSGGNLLLASGGNDNVVRIWNATSSMRCMHKFEEHDAAVKALAWSPHQFNILASGGGTDDQCIKIWDVQTGKCIKSVFTGSQVSALEWNMHEKELLSGHGYSVNHLYLWKYPSMSRVVDLKGHQKRVLCLSQNPQGSTVVSAGADETLRFWKVFQLPNKSDSLLSLERFHIR